MSPLTAGIASLNSRESFVRAAATRPSGEMPRTTGRRRAISRRLAPLAAVTLVGAAGTTAHMLTEQHHPNLIAAQKIHALEAKGYRESACTQTGMLMRDPATGQSVTVKY